ncbi:MAG: hypothetical protein R2787_00240 [Saprospiraceae bacterium]
MTVECDAVPVVPILTATDNCDVNVTITYNQVTTLARLRPDSYVLTRTWVAIDNCDNATTHVQKITVVDTTLLYWLCACRWTADCGGSNVPPVNGNRYR